MPGAPGRGDLPPTKTVAVYRNGDAFFPGRKIVVNPRQVSTFDSFLTSLTGGVEAPFGAVRRLYTPVLGHRIRHLDRLEHGGVYVAAGNEQFKLLDYSEITTKKPERKKKQQIRPVVHSRIVVSARWKRTTDESCTINVFTNGDVLVPAARVRIPKYTLRSWEHVLAMVTEKVHLRTGAVHRLCKLDGHPVCTSTELENNQRYVAVGAERFKSLPYDQCVPRFSIREHNSTESRDVLPPIRKSRHAKDVFPHTGFGADLEHTARGQMKKLAAKPDRTKQPRQVSQNAALFSTGEGSVFNAKNKRREMAGAAEVQEDGQLKVDLPIDQVEAKIVEEEDEDGSCSASACKAPLQDSDGSGQQRSLSAGSPEGWQWESVKSTGQSSGSGDSGLKTPEPQEAEGREVSSRLSRTRSRMSRLFKVDLQVTQMQSVNGDSSHGGEKWQVKGNWSDLLTQSHRPATQNVNSWSSSLSLKGDFSAELENS